MTSTTGSGPRPRSSPRGPKGQALLPTNTTLIDTARTIRVIATRADAQAPIAVTPADAARSVDRSPAS